MPTNLPPQAQALWLKAQEAKTKEEKLERLQEFLSAIPDHKGTEKLRKQIRHQIAVLRDELESERSRRKGSGLSLLVKREGALQAVLVGAVGCGKTAIFLRLTGVTISGGGFMEVKQPTPGVVRFEDVPIQLVDTPPLYLGSLRQPSLTLASARNADLLIPVFDGSKPIRDQLTTLENFLDECRIRLRVKKGQVRVEKTASGGIRIMTTGSPRCTPDDVSRYLVEMGVRNAVVVINGPADMDDVEAALLGYVFKPSVALVTRRASVASGELDLIRSVLPSSPVVCELQHNFADAFPREIYAVSGFIRVYTKPVTQKERSEKPIFFKAGSTIRDVVNTIHSSLLATFEYARVWGSSVRYQGAKVGLDHVLADGDTVEVHA
ncbi:MAG: TGS domain-containing protein [Thermoprotei archaeon]